MESAIIFVLHKMIDGLSDIIAQPSGNPNCLSGNHNMLLGIRDGMIILIVGKLEINFSFPNNHIRRRDGLAGCRKTIFESII